MMKAPPRYTNVELQILMDAPISYPENITELDFQNQIQKNNQIRWDVNPFMLEDSRIRILLEANRYHRWRATKWVGSLVGTFMSYWALRTWTPEMFLLILLLPFTVIATSHGFFIILVGSTILIKTLFHLSIPLFWIIILLVGISFGLNKTSDDRAKAEIIKQGLSTWENFWKYYSNQIIYPIANWNSSELKDLIDRYPELALSKKYV